ncbi:16080_t:CDS:1, partial [Funneliformis geosporum]
NDPEMINFIAHSFKALKTTLGELKNYYSEFKVSQHIDNLSLQQPASFPYPFSFKTDNNNDINFIYKDQLYSNKLVLEYKDKIESLKISR